jgi:hypothetical protein
MRGPLVLFLIAAGLVGFAGGYVLGARSSAPAEVPVAAAAASAAEPCAPPAAPQTEQLVQAQAQVDTLATALRQKEAELAAAVAEAEKATDQREALQAKARELEKSVSGLRGELGRAESERDRLYTELKQTVEKLDVQVAATEAARAEAATWQARSEDEGWGRFLAEAQTEICSRGTAKRIEGCQEAVQSALNPSIRDRYLRCLRGRGAVPSLGQLARGGVLPEHAEALPDDKRFPTKGWYVLLCDPTLPEAGEGAEDDEAP